MKLYLVRHGQTVSSTLADDDLLPDDDNNKLTEDGKLEAHALGEFFKSACQSPIIWSSPLERAIETSEIIERNTQITPRIAPLLAERYFNFKGDTTIEKSRSLQNDSHARPFQEIESAESVAAHRKRVSAWFDETIAHLDAADVILVSHGGTIEMIQMHLTGAPVDYVSHMFTRLDTGRFHVWTRLRAHDGRFVWRLDGVNVPPR